MNAEQAWQSVLGQLQLEMPRASFDTWVRDTRPVSYHDGTLTISVRNAYARDWLESRLASTVSRLLLGIMNVSVAVNFIVNSNNSEQLMDQPHSTADQPATFDQRYDEMNGSLPGGRAEAYEQRSRNSGMNPRYIFDTYVVGAGNRLAHAACLAVAENQRLRIEPSIR